MLFRSKGKSLRQSKTLLLQKVHLYRKKKKKLTPSHQETLEKALRALEQAILEKDRTRADQLSIALENLCLVPLKKSFLEKSKDLTFALLFALSAAIVIRQMWFELYEIPSGSMRPTFKEKDRLIVSKTDLGINLPLTVKHLYLDPDLVKRNNIVIFSGEGMDIPDVDTMYFYLFPGKKQYVKRLIGKPGDTLYFYGGQIYGIDKQGNDISKELQDPKLCHIEHIPFIDFMRKVTLSRTPSMNGAPSLILYQMNEPIAKLSLSSHFQVKEEMLSLEGIHDKNAPAVTSYSDLWGIGNFAMTRLLTADQVRFLTTYELEENNTAPLYLEITHHPSLKTAKLIQDEAGKPWPVLGVETSLIPLNEEHLRRLFDALYTARFEVKNGFAFRYGADPHFGGKNIFLPHLMQVPHGIYEFDAGKAYKIGWEGISTPLAKTDPLYHFDEQRIQMLYNIGMEWDTRYTPQNKQQRLKPARYAYFKNGDLYLMGAPILKKEDPLLQQFVKEELKKAQNSNYEPFIDAGAPLLNNGSLNTDFIRQYGLQIPENMYLVLGDNHAMSGDSREFGFVPSGNLRGGPSFIFWPPGPRIGAPTQLGYPWMTLPNLTIWTLAALSLGGSYLYWRRKNKLPLEF